MSSEMGAGRFRYLAHGYFEELETAKTKSPDDDTFTLEDVDKYPPKGGDKLIKNFGEKRLRKNVKYLSNYWIRF